MTRVAQHMNALASASASATAAAAPVTVTFVNVATSSNGDDCLQNDDYAGIVRAFAASAAARRASYARDCHICGGNNIEVDFNLPISSSSPTPQICATIFKVLASAQALVLQPPHSTSSLSSSSSSASSYASSPPVPLPTSSVFAAHATAPTPPSGACVHIRFVTSGSSSSSTVHAVASKLDQSIFPMLFSSACPEIDVSYSAFNVVMRPCESVIRNDLAAAARSHLTLTNKERCALMLSRLLDFNVGIGSDSHSTSDVGSVVHPSPQTGSRSSIASSGGNLTHASSCLWFHDAAAAVAIFSHLSAFAERAVAAFVPLLQRSSQQRIYAILLRLQEAARVLGAAASRRSQQMAYIRSLHTLLQHNASASAAAVIFRRAHSNTLRRSFLKSAESVTSASAAVASISAFILRFSQRSAWSRRVKGMAALTHLTARRRSCREQIAGAAAVAGFAVKVGGGQVDVWITSTGGVLKLYTSEMSLQPQFGIKLGEGVLITAWGGGWRLSVGDDGEGVQIDDGDANRDDESLFHIQISASHMSLSPASSILLTFPHPLTSVISSSGSPAACLVFLKKIIFGRIFAAIPPVPFPFTFRSCSTYCHAIRQVNAMIAAVDAVSTSAHHRISNATADSPKMTFVGSSSSLISRIAAAHFLSQAASRTVLSLQRRTVMRQLSALICRLRAAPVHRKWRRFATCVKRTVLMAGVLHVVIGTGPMHMTLASSASQRLSATVAGGSIVNKSFISLLHTICHPFASSSSSSAWKSCHQPSSFRNPAFSLYHATVCRLRYAVF